MSMNTWQETRSPREKNLRTVHKIFLQSTHRNSSTNHLLSSGADRMLDRNRIRVERHLLFRMHSVAGRINDRRRHKNHQVLLARTRGFAPEEPPQKRQIAKDRNLVLNLRSVF